MEDQLNLVRSIFSSDGFRNADQDQQRVIIGQIIETRELSQEQIMKLYDESQDLSNLPGLSNTSNISVSQATQLANLPYDVFTNIILTGDIRGEDLLSLCNSSKVIQEYCKRALVLPTGQKVSQYLYRQLIEKERPGYLVGDQEQPRDVYQQLTTKRLEDLWTLLKFLEDVQDNEMDPDDNKKLIPPRNLQMLLYNYTQDQWALLFRGLKLDLNDPTINKAIAIKAFLDQSNTLLIDGITALSKRSNLETLIKMKIIPEANIEWNVTQSFPAVLNSFLENLNIDLETLVGLLRTVLRRKKYLHSTIRKALDKFRDGDIIKLWENYEGFYLVTLNALLPKDNKSLEKLILDGLRDVVRNFIQRYNVTLEDTFERIGIGPTEEQQETLGKLIQVSLDFDTGVYDRIIRCLVKIHKGVLNQHYSIFTPLGEIPQ